MSDNVEELETWDWADTEQVPDGYDWKSIPKCTQHNFIKLVEKVNELTREVNILKGGQA